MDAYTSRLSDYLDDEDLSPAERAEIEGHLRGCAECRATLEELREVVGQAAALTDSAPETDLWSGIQDRLGSRDVVPFPARAARRVSFTIPQLVAAGLALMVLSGSMVWMMRVGQGRADLPPMAASEGPRPVNVSTTDAGYEEAIADLERALEAGRDRLDPQTIRVIEANLMAIDRMIAQSREALAADASNSFLNMHLADARRRKLELLRSATALTNKM
jgi:anti-sigma factor RsiW